jgi:hypothetical protein
VARHQLLEGQHVTGLGFTHQDVVSGGGIVAAARHVFDGGVQGTYSPLHNLPLLLGTAPAMRGSRWQARSTALAKALKSASTT